MEGKLRLGVLASHGGTNLQAIIDACKDGRLDAEIAVVISNNSNSMAIERAKTENLPFCHLSSSTHPQPPLEDIAMRAVLKDHRVDLVVLAGYMKLLGPATLAAYRNRVLNSHPALLPKFGGRGMYGSRVHEAVVEAAESISGVTIHLVDDQYDHGAVVGQCTVPVLQNDAVGDLEEKVKDRERLFWIEVLSKITLGEINLDALATPAVPHIQPNKMLKPGPGRCRRGQL